MLFRLYLSIAPSLGTIPSKEALMPTWSDDSDDFLPPPAKQKRPLSKTQKAKSESKRGLNLDVSNSAAIASSDISSSGTFFSDVFSVYTLI